MRAGTSSWILATIGMTLQPGDSLKSVEDSYAAVTFFEGSIIELDGATQILLSEISVADSGSTTINLKQAFGKTTSRVEKLIDRASTYEIETPAAVAAVRGSTMVLFVQEDGTTIVENVNGDIRIIAQGVEVIIPEEMQSTVEPGNVPDEPVDTARIQTGIRADNFEVHIGESISYTYTISNTGNIQITGVSVSDDIAGTPVLNSGDTNANSKLDPDETWTYTASYMAGASDPPSLVNTVTFSVTLNNGNVLVAKDSITVTIIPDEPLIITTESLSDGVVGVEYNQVLTAIGGTAPYTWSISGGTLPPGLTLNGNIISGTPTAAGTFKLDIIATANDVTTTAYLSIIITEPLTIVIGWLFEGVVGVEYNQVLTATGGTAPYTWSISGGTLPPGLTLNGNIISGTPTASGSFNIDIMVTDSRGATAIVNIYISITIPPNQEPAGAQPY